MAVLQRKSLFVSLISVLLAALPGAASTQQAPTPDQAIGRPIAIPGTGVSLTPPAGFRPAQQFPGFALPDSDASIVVTVLPAPYREVSSGFQAGVLASRGIRLLNGETVEVAGQPARLLELAQNARGLEYRKWLIASGDERATLLITATYPQARAEALAQALRASLLTFRWDRDAELDFFAGMPFQLTAREPFRPAQKIGNNVLLTLDGGFPPADPSAPLVVASASMTQSLTVDDRHGLAERRLHQYPNFAQVEVLSRREVNIDGLPGVELRARGIDIAVAAGNEVDDVVDNDVDDDVDDLDAGEAGGAQRQRYALQTMLFNDDGYLLLVGFCDLAARERYEPAFAALFRSLRRQ